MSGVEFNGPDPPWYESAADLLAEPDPGPTPFLVERLSVDKAIVAIQGPPKVGKTWLVLELAVSVVTGREAFGRFAIPEPGPVLVVLEESGRAALHRRLDALARGYALEPKALAGLHFAANKRVRLDDPAWLERLAAAGRAIGARAILLDPLARVKGPRVDENSQKEIGPVLDSLRVLRDETGAAVGFVHHTPHEGGHLRGSSDIEATWESKLSITRDESGVCSIEAEHREAESSGTFRYRLVFDGLTRTVRLTPVESQDEPTHDENVAERMAGYLAENEPTPTEDLAKAVQARVSTVKKIAESDLRFALAPSPPPGRKHNAKCWTLAELLDPSAGTSRDEQSTGHPASCSSPGSYTPEGGEPREEQSSPRRNCSSLLRVPGDPGFLDLIRTRYRFGHVTQGEWLGRVRLHRQVAPSVQGTLEASTVAGLEGNSDFNGDEPEPDFEGTEPEGPEA